MPGNGRKLGAQKFKTRQKESLICTSNGFWNVKKAEMERDGTIERTRSE
jgi:hypothetical protein